MSLAQLATFAIRPLSWGLKPLDAALQSQDLCGERTSSPPFMARALQSWDGKEQWLSVTAQGKIQNWLSHFL